VVVNITHELNSDLGVFYVGKGMDKRFTMLSGMCGLLMFTACAKPPTEQIEATEKSIQEAQASGASTYLPEEFTKLQGMLAALKKEESDQAGKFALFRDYGKVDQLAVTTKSEAERLQIEATKKKEEARVAALQAQQVAQEAVKTTFASFAKAPTGKDRAAVEAMKADADALKASLNQVQMAIDTSDYPTAQTKATAIHEKSRAVSQEIEAALAKIGKGKASVAKKK
jgi:hypothetical protein